MSEPTATEVRAMMLREVVERLIGKDQVIGFYTGVNAMMVAPELWRAIIKDLEAEPERADLATAARHAIEQGSGHLRAVYESICADTPEPAP